MTLLAIVALLLLPIAWVLMTKPRRREGEQFDWSHRRRWWRPRWAFPDDR